MAVLATARRGVMNIRSLVAVAPIVADPAAGARFYRDTLGLSLDGDPDVYLSTEKLDGIQHFGLWPQSGAARTCFGVDEWPRGRPAPQACVGFDVADLDAAVRGLRRAGHEMVGDAETQPWGTTVTRWLSPDGLVVVVGHTPREK